MDAVFAHRGLAFSVEAAAGFRSRSPMEAQHVNDSSRDPCSPAYRRFAHMAIQQRMGLLSKRRIGFGGSDPASARPERKTLEALPRVRAR